MSKKRWTKVEDERLRHTWMCPTCKVEALVFPGFCGTNGGPVCAQCDEDMEYQYTEVLVPEGTQWRT